MEDGLQEFWVIFSDGENGLSGFLRKGFSHCEVLTRDKYNWIRLAPNRTNLDIEILNYSVAEDIPIKVRIMDPNKTVLKIVVRRSLLASNNRVVGIKTCVSLVKYIIGIKVFAITPYGLFKKLSKGCNGKKQFKGVESISYIL